MGRSRSRSPLWFGLLAIVLTFTACAARYRATGVVTNVEGGLDRVTAFTVRTTDGDDLTFVPSETGDFEFPLSHLRAHLIAGDPVIVELEEEADRLVATFVSDG